MHDHEFRKLSDEAIYCKCGEIRRVQEATPCYHVCSHVCNHQWYYPTTYPTWISPSTVTYTTGQLTTGSTTRTVG